MKSTLFSPSRPPQRQKRQIFLLTQPAGRANLLAEEKTELDDLKELGMKMRGVNKSSSVMVTSTLRGVFRDDRARGAEVLNLMLNGRR